MRWSFFFFFLILLLHLFEKTLISISKGRQLPLASFALFAIGLKRQLQSSQHVVHFFLFLLLLVVSSQPSKANQGRQRAANNQNGKVVFFLIAFLFWRARGAPKCILNVCNSTNRRVEIAGTISFFGTSGLHTHHKPNQNKRKKESVCVVVASTPFSRNCLCVKSFIHPSNLSLLFIRAHALSFTRTS